LVQAACERGPGRFLRRQGLYTAFPAMNAAEHLLGEDALARHGARVALVCGEEVLSYRALAAEVGRAANALRALGVRPGERVLLLLRDTPEFVAAWLGTVQAGAVAIGLNTKLGEEDYRHVLADSGARLLIAEDALLGALGPLARQLAQENRLATSARWREAVRCAEATAAFHDARPEDAAFWLYSSGTTGRPKGIVHAHRDVLPAGQAQREVVGLAAGDTVFATSKLFFAYALENGLLGPLALGATAILHPEWADVEQIQAIVARHRPTAVFSVPTFYRRLLALQPERLAPFRGVRHCVSAGERLPESVFEAWRAATGREILSVYGMSETFCVIMARRPAVPAYCEPASRSRAWRCACAATTRAKLQQACRACCGYVTPRSAQATPTGRRKHASSSATAGSAPGTSSSVMRRASTRTRGVATSW